MKKTVFNFALALALAVNTAVFASGDTEFFSGGKITLSGKAEKNASVTVTVLKESLMHQTRPKRFAFATARLRRMKKGITRLPLTSAQKVRFTRFIRAKRAKASLNIRC